MNILTPLFAPEEICGEYLLSVITQSCTPNLGDRRTRMVTQWNCAKTGTALTPQQIVPISIIDTQCFRPIESKPKRGFPM